MEQSSCECWPGKLTKVTEQTLAGQQGFLTASTTIMPSWNPSSPAVLADTGSSQQGSVSPSGTCRTGSQEDAWADTRLCFPGVQGLVPPGAVRGKLQRRPGPCKSLLGSHGAWAERTVPSPSLTLGWESRQCRLEGHTAEEKADTRGCGFPSCT